MYGSLYVHTYTQENDRILIKTSSHYKNHKIKSMEEMKETGVQEEKQI